MFHGSFKDRKFQKCFKKVLGVFQGRLKGYLEGVLRMFQGHWKFKEVGRVVPRYFKDVLRNFQGSCCGHQGEFSLVASIKVKFLTSVTKNGVLSF